MKNRNPFNITDFAGNDKTPVETRDGRKVIIYNTNRLDEEHKVCGDIILREGDYAPVELCTWDSDGHYFPGDGDESPKDLFFVQKG